MENNFYIAELLSRAIRNQITDEELKELQTWLAIDQRHADLFKKLSSAPYLLEKNDIYTLFNKEKVWTNLTNNLFEVKVIKLNTQRFLRYAAGIALPLLMASGLYYYYSGYFKSDRITSIDQVIIPGDHKATLVLSDGKAIDFKENQPRSSTKNGVAEITNDHNALSYSIGENNHDQNKNNLYSLPLVLNELITPLGGSYNVTLSDGTRVWLNSASSLRFPVSFTDSTRHVYVKGEAYFDVKHNGKPFIVTTNKMDIRVLGTKFDVSSYADEINTSTTLVEGSIRFSTAYESTLLMPGQQALLSQNNVSIRNVNTRQYSSWVDGKIEFNNEDLEAVMRRLARWYNFKFTFEKEKAKHFHFTGRIDNTQTISSILSMLHMTTDVTFDLQEKTIVIK